VHKRLSITKTILIIATLVTIFFAFSCSKSGTSSARDADTSRKLYLYNWTYYTPDIIIKKFEKEFKAKVIIDNYASNEDMFAKLRASSGGYDIVIPSADYTSIMIKLGMVQPLDHDKLPNLIYIEEKARQLAEYYDPGYTYSVPYFIGAAGIAVNTEKVKDYPRDWTIFGETALAGRMQLLDDMAEVLGIAQVTLGYSVNTTDTEELQRTADFINTQWKPNIVKFDSEGMGKAFSQGEYWVSHSYPENIAEEVPEAFWDTIDFFIPEIGGPLYIDSMVILDKAPNPDLAHEFINFFHRPEIYALFLDEFHHPSTLNSGVDKFRKVEPFYDMVNLENYELKVDLGEDLEKYNKVWQTIRYH
jgi:spermidine/putrescine transport system substrate-binding protein